MSNARHDITATIYNRKGKVLAIGKNSYCKTHPLQAKHAKRAGLEDKIFLHAEISALVKCRDKPYKMKIERYGKKGQPLLAKPCPVCELAIQEAGVVFVEYTIGS